MRIEKMTDISKAVYEANSVKEIHLDITDIDESMLLKANKYQFTTKDTRLLFDVKIHFEIYRNHYTATLECNGVLGKSGRFSKKFCKVVEVSIIEGEEKEEKLLYRNKKGLPIFADKSIRKPNNPKEATGDFKDIISQLGSERDTIFKLFKRGLKK